jgi:signal transduction histidine kinase
MKRAMTDPTIIDLVLQDRRIAYVTADANLRIVEAGGFLAIFGEDYEAKPGDWLLDLSPELVGSESVLFDILNGDLPRFQLEHINRSTADDNTRYITVTALPYHSNRGDAKLLVLATDTSEQGQSEQKLTQQRNELRLLRRNLAAANEQLDTLLRRYVPAEDGDHKTTISSLGARVPGAIMNPTVIDRILQDRRIAYAITDRDLDVLEVGGLTDEFYPDHDACVGRPLLELIPELVGSERVLANILEGELPRFQLGWINRETADGQTVYLTMATLPYHDSTGRITGLLHLVEDHTEMGTIDQQLAQQRNELRLLRDKLARQNIDLAVANAELERLDDVKTMFVSVAAHELRTPLTPITGFLEMLLDEEFGPLAELQRESLEIVNRSTKRLEALTNDLLDLTRLEAGRLAVVLNSTDLPALIESVAAEYRPQLNAKSQHLTLHIQLDVPPALCDEARASQIIGNLISNASKYTLDGGEITVSLTLADEEGFVQVSVMDTGIGISAEDQERLFERFFRAKSAGEARAPGTGLGLYITRSLVELHGGEVWFESEIGQGSTFHVTFPIADDPPPALIETTEPYKTRAFAPTRDTAGLEP